MPGKASASPAYWRYAGERQRSPVFAGFPGGNPAAAAERFHGVRIRGTSQRNENLDVGARQA
jgi:hypothetical protein